MLMYNLKNKQIKTAKLANYFTAILNASIIIRVCKPLTLGARTV